MGAVFGKTSAGFHGHAPELAGPGAVPCREPPSANNPRKPGGAGGCRRQHPGIRPITLPASPVTCCCPALLPQYLAGVYAGENQHGCVVPRSHSACCCPVHSRHGLNFCQTFCFRGEKKILGKKKKRMALRLCSNFSQLPARLVGWGLFGLPEAAACCSFSLNFTDYI